jgi:hypothetical protein
MALDLDSRIAASRERLNSLSTNAEGYGERQ